MHLVGHHKIEPADRAECALALLSSATSYISHQRRIHDYLAILYLRSATANSDVAHFIIMYYHSFIYLGRPNISIRKFNSCLEIYVVFPGRNTTLHIHVLCTLSFVIFLFLPPADPFQTERHIFVIKICTILWRNPECFSCVQCPVCISILASFTLIINR